MKINKIKIYNLKFTLESFIRRKKFLFLILRIKVLFFLNYLRKNTKKEFKNFLKIRKEKNLIIKFNFNYPFLLIIY